jgi:cell division septum initiation protein DivIVA
MNHDQHTELLPLGDAGNQFALVMRGFDRGQVLEHIERLETDLRAVMADRDVAASRSADLAAQLAAAHGEIEALRIKMQRLELPTPENIGERVRHMLALAEEEANEVRSRAHEDTASLQARADRLSAEIEAKHNEADGYAGRLVTEAEQRATTILADAEKKAREALDDAQREQERRDVEAAGKRRQADDDFDIALRARRTEQTALDAERRASVAQECDQRLSSARTESHRMVSEAQAEAHRLVTGAREQAGRIVAGAREQVEALRAQRRQVLDHLAGIRGALDGMPTADALEASERDAAAAPPENTPVEAPAGQGQPAS